MLVVEDSPMPQVPVDTVAESVAVVPITAPQVQLLQERVNRLEQSVDSLRNLKTKTVTVAKDGFAQEDTNGFGMTLISMVVVLSALFFLFLIFKYLGRFIDFSLSRRSARTVPTSHGSNRAWDRKAIDQAGVIAAISLALHESNSLRHDEEIVQITIQEFSRRYSPWNSKSYAVLHNRLRR